MPSGHLRHATLIWKDRMYTIGGIYGKTVDAYNFAENTWKSEVPLPQTRFDTGSCCSDSAIFIAGGFKGVNYTLSNDILSYDASKWTIVNFKLPLKLRNLTIAAITEHELLILGGRTNDDMENEIV
jgi:hypothetical protein